MSEKTRFVSKTKRDGWKMTKDVKGLSCTRTCVLSSDLTAASDLLPLDLVGSIVEGLIKGCKLEVTNDIVREEETKESAKVVERDNELL